MFYRVIHVESCPICSGQRDHGGMSHHLAGRFRVKSDTRIPGIKCVRCALACGVLWNAAVDAMRALLVLQKCGPPCS